jgi:hypothetical protein
MPTASTFAGSRDLVFAAQDAGRIFGFAVGAGVWFGFLMASRVVVFAAHGVWCF